MSKYIEKVLNPEHKTRAEIEALENPEFGDQYYDTTNEIYVIYNYGWYERLVNFLGIQG